MGFSNRYILVFAVLLCIACALGVSTVAVGLKERQEVNMKLDRRTNVLRVAGVLQAGDAPSPDEVNAYFEDGRVQYLVVDRVAGTVVEDPTTIEDVESAELFEPTKWAKEHSKDAELVEPVPREFRGTQVRFLPRYLQVIKVRTDQVDCLVLPIEGYGLWSTLKGFLAVSRDLSEVVGITYYEHGETPGLGGEVDNPSWKAQFPGKEVYTEDGAPKLTVKKAGLVTDPSYQVDGMAGATITTDGVDLMLRFWLGDHGYGPFLKSQSADA